jgi:hypothetical protein
MNGIAEPRALLTPLQQVDRAEAVRFGQMPAVEKDWSLT